MEESKNNSSLAAIREELITEIRMRVEDKILEKTNADLLEKLIRQADTTTEAISIAQLGTTYKVTGMHYDKRIEKFGNTIKYFKKNKALSFSDGTGNAPHKLIIGDNFDALQNLLIEYRGMVDVIYIDPPYGKDSMGEFAKTNYNNALTRDNLLSMLYPRLVLAKRLLADTGVIFCSIDDKNQAYVKCLFDDAFGESNFAGNLIVQTATDNNISQIDTEHEYILCYAKSIKQQPKWFIPSEKAPIIIEQYEKLKGKGLSIDDIQKSLREWINKHKDKLKRVTHYNCVDEKGVYTANTNSSNTKPGGYTFDIIHPTTQRPCVKPDFGWRWTEETFLEFANNNEVEWGVDETTQPHLKKRIETATDTLKSVIYEDGRKSTKTLENILGCKKMFDNPKPIDLLCKLLRFTTAENAIVLDFFAGSGTTGQAVLDLNRKDNGNRTFILCQADEKTEKNPNGIAHDVTTKRLKRVMTGCCYDGTSDYEWAKKNEPFGGSLDVYDIATVSNAEKVEGKTAFDMIDETLYGKQRFATVEEKIKWVCENFEQTQRMVENDAEWEKRQEGE